MNLSEVDGQRQVYKLEKIELKKKFKKNITIL